MSRTRKHKRGKCSYCGWDLKHGECLSCNPKTSKDRGKGKWKGWGAGGKASHKK